MKRRDFLITSVLGSAGAAATLAGAGSLVNARAGGEQTRAANTNRKILIAGGGFGTAFIKYMAELTGKPRPKLCYLPTATGDSPASIISWFRSCASLNVEASAQESFIASTRQDRSWEEVFLSVDGIVVSGGNTLNQQAIWKAQGIDLVLKQAWDKGIVLGGASAGSLCWFEEGTTDSRPKVLTTVQCLGFLKGQSLPALRSRTGTAAAVPETDRLGADEAWLRLRQRRGDFLRGQRRQARRLDAAGRQGVLRQRREWRSRRARDGAGADHFIALNAFSTSSRSAWRKTDSPGRGRSAPG